MSLDSLLLGDRTRPRQQFRGPQPATVNRLDGADLYVELAALPDVEVGPCRWSKPDATTAAPAVGTACLVQLVGDGLGDAWVIAWDRWPA